MKGHNHGGASHLLGMVGIGVALLLVLMATGRSFSQALPLAASLACPLMMIGMMFTMGGHRHEHGESEHTPAAHRHHDDEEPSIH